MNIWEHGASGEMNMKVGFICLSSLAVLCAEAKFVDAKIETRGPVQTTNETVSGKAASLLPPGKK